MSTSILAQRCPSICDGTYGHAGHRLAQTTDVTETVHYRLAIVVLIYSSVYFCPRGKEQRRAEGKSSSKAARRPSLAFLMLCLEQSRIFLWMKTSSLPSALPALPPCTWAKKTGWKGEKAKNFFQPCHVKSVKTERKQETVYQNELLIKKLINFYSNRKLRWFQTGSCFSRLAGQRAAAAAGR